MASEDHRLQTRESIFYLLPNRKNEREKKRMKVLVLELFSSCYAHIENSQFIFIA